MPKLPRIPSELVMRALKRGGFYEYHCVGSHMQFRHIRKIHLKVTIPFSKKDLNPKTLKSILEQAELSVQEFIKLLKN